VLADYESAAIRHLSDAELLRSAGMGDNAGHLVGFAAECAIKHRITALHPAKDSPHGHFPDLITIARKHLGPRGANTAMFDILKNEIFKDWHVNRRYCTSGETTQQELDAWFQTTKRLFATARLKARLP
jgi:hypothetical protein